MPDDPTPAGHRAPRGRAHRAKGSFDWRHPTSWTKNQRWGAGSGAVALVVVILLVVLLVGGGATNKPVSKKAGTSTTTAPTTSTISNKSGGKPGPPLCPLTGTPAPGGKIPMRPALAFKIDNYPDARPWSGIDKADIVFEEPVEGFITRLFAVFQCQQASLVGPIRSARYVDQGIANLLSDPILIHVGSIQQVTNVLDSPPSRLQNIDLRYPEYSSIVNNPPGRYAPYDTYSSTSGGWGLFPKDKTPPVPVFQYSAAVPQGRPDSTLAIDFSSTSDETWTYHSNTHTYTLSYADTGQAMVQQPNGQLSPIATTNIVVQVVNYTLGPWVENSEGGLEVMAVPTGRGPLEVLRNGIFVRGTWSRASLNAPLQLKSASGSIIKLKPGTTWVEMVPSGQPVAPTP
ncbi:MAG: DUF3048 domain-containing protein [Acidimicrobiales bacterium]